MNSGILCNYCKQKQGYFLDRTRKMAACGRCAFDIASGAISNMFTHWKALDNDRA